MTLLQLVDISNFDVPFGFKVILVGELLCNNNSSTTTGMSIVFIFPYLSLAVYLATYVPAVL